MTRKTAVSAACIIAILHLVLASVYSTLTPYRTGGILLGQRNPETGGFQQVPDVGAPDERQHANYTLRLVRGEGFPILDPKDPNLIENYQAHQPPLFYLLHAGWVKVTGCDLTSKDNGFSARLINGVIGSATVLGVFFLGLWSYKREDVGLVAAAFVALLPMNVALSGAVSNDPLLYCLCTWSLAVLARGSVFGWTIKLAAILGLLVGLAILTKSTAVALLPVLAFAAMLGPNRPRGAHLAVCVLLVALVSVPWLARNQSLYGDPLALSAFNEAFKNSPSRELITGIAEVANPGKDPNVAYWVDWVGWWTARSFFGVFGYMDVFLNERGIPASGPNNPNLLYRLLLSLGVLAFAGWALALRKVEWKVHGKQHWILGSFLAIVIILFVRFNAQYFQGQARYLFPAIGVIGMGVAIALLNVFRFNWKLAFGAVVLLLGGLNAYALFKLPAEFARRAIVVQSALQTQTGHSYVLPGNDAKIDRV